MKLKTSKLPDELTGEILVNHAQHGLMIAKWNGNRKLPSYDAVGFRPGTDHGGSYHPLVVIQLYPSEMANLKGWLELPHVE